MSYEGKCLPYEQKRLGCEGMCRGDEVGDSCKNKVPVDLYDDLAAERPIAVERAGQKIVVEIKSFVGRSLMTDFHLAVGQYRVYQMLLQETEPEYDLYLAVDDITYENFFRREGIEFLVRTSQIKIFVVNIDEQEIVQWLS